MSSAIETLFIPGPTGRLEALLNSGSASATHAALVCHPHPLHGGTLHNKVVYNAMKVLQGHGFPVLRFNFRGAGLSEGTHDNGRGEVDDVRCALDWLSERFHLPLIFAGFSFGTAVGLRAACADHRVAGCLSLGTPVDFEGRNYSYEFLKSCAKPKLFVSGGEDHLSPAIHLQSVVAVAAPPTKLVFIPDADHFFAGKINLLRLEIDSWLREVLLAG